jgi:hypothetical protein
LLLLQKWCHGTMGTQGLNKILSDTHTLSYTHIHSLIRIPTNTHPHPLTHTHTNEIGRKKVKYLFELEGVGYIFVNEYCTCLV